MPFYVVGIALIAYSLIDFDRSLFLFIGFKFFLNSNITVISIPGVPSLSLDLLMSIVYVALYLVKRKKGKAKHSFPLITPLLLIYLSSAISAVFSIAGIGSELTNLIKNIFLDFIVIVILWETLERQKEFKYLFNVITIVILISCVYAIFEYSVNTNPLSIYEATLNHDASKIIDASYEINARGYRVNSIFEHCIGAGVTWSIYSLFVLYSYVYKNCFIKIKWFHLVLALFAAFCVVLTKMRSCIIFFAIGSIGLFNFRKKKTIKITAVVILSLIIVFAFGLIPEELSLIMGSITNAKYQDMISGSTISMRIDQFAAAIELLMINPLFGLGERFQDVLSNSITVRLFGSESIWLLAITRRGILGVISEIVFFYYLVVKLPKMYSSKPMFWVSLSYFLTYTITTLPGIIMPCFYFFIMFYIKTSKRYVEYQGPQITEWSLKRTALIHRKLSVKRLRGRQIAKYEQNY